MEWNRIKTGILLILIFFNITQVTYSQIPGKFWVKFKDKAGSPYSISSPSSFLSVKALDRRTKQSIMIDETDIPVNQTYVDLVNVTGAQVLGRSKWINGVIVNITTPMQLSTISGLPFVDFLNPVGKYIKTKPDVPFDPSSKALSKTTSKTAAYNYGPSITQVSQIGADCMHNMGYRGQNMLIAVIDAGFKDANITAVFDSLRNEGRILHTRDYVDGNTSVYEDDAHGAMVLSCIAGNSPGNLIGTGPKASVVLLRSENALSEKIIEEYNYIVAAEFADSVGADIITTSLGYSTFDDPSKNHVYADLNGRTSSASIAATMAARKGIFVLNAAGNEGASAWRYISIPSDADSICTVGSVNGSGIHSGFSSVGPTSDGRIKPDLSAMGEGAFVCQPGNIYTPGNGTSFATPILAGAIACLWQANPTRSNMQLLEAVRATASKYPVPDNDYGWGIPNMCAANLYLKSLPYASVKTIDKIELSIFPNPTHHQVYFTLNGIPKSALLSDVIGQSLPVNYAEVGNNKYVLSPEKELSNGVYFLTIKTTEGIITTKFIKE